MKEYRKKEKVFAFKWDGNKSDVDEMNKIAESNNYSDDYIKMGFTENDTLYITHHYSDGGASHDFVRIGEYVVFDISNFRRRVANYSESFFNEKYVEL